MPKHILKYDFNPNSDLRMEVVALATLMQQHAARVVVPHRTNFYHIFLFGDCAPTHIVDFQPVPIQPHSVLLLDKARVHQFDASLAYSGKVLVFTDDFFCLQESDSLFLKKNILFNNILQNPNIPLYDGYPFFDGLFEQIAQEARQPDAGTSHVILKNMLHNLLLFIEREMRNQQPQMAVQTRVLAHTLQLKEAIEHHFLEFKDVASYAGMLHLSEKRLGQATMQVLGKTPKALIDERVLLEAQRLLLYSKLSVKEIAFHLGFGEPTNFNKYFRKHTQQTPAAFRDGYPMGA